MFLKYIDIISPNLTLFFKGNLSHSNIFSGIISLLIYLISIFSIIYFSFDIIFRLNPTSYFYHKTLLDSGNFVLNSESIFHYVSIYGIKYDEKKFKVFGLKNKLINLYINYPNSFSYDHYIYEPCSELNENWKKNNMKSMNLSLIKNHQGLCITKFYNATNKKIIYYNDSNFEYPNLKYGTNNEKNIWYGIFIRACQNDSIVNKNYCNSNEEIKNFINLNFPACYMSFLNSEIEIENYKNPISYSPYSISTSIKNNEFFANHVNIQPLKLKSHNGLLFETIDEKSSYRFESLEKQSYSTSEPIFASFYFWLQSNLYIYERSYKKVTNIMAEIGGLINACIVFGKIINFLINKYIILLDFEKLLFSINKKINEKNASFNNVINLHDEINLNNKIISKIKFNKDLINNSNQNFITTNSNQNNINCNNANPIMNNYTFEHKNNTVKKIDKKNHISYEENSNINIEKKFNQMKSSRFSTRNSLQGKKLLFLNNKQSIIFFDYLKYFFCNLKKNKFGDSINFTLINIKYRYIYNIENLYKKLISEESFVVLTYEFESIKNYLNKLNAG